MNRELRNFIERLDSNTISTDRKTILDKLVDFILSKKRKGQSVRLNFICTHNSRRSHLGQIWSKTLSHFFAIRHVDCYSGGTESTAVYPKIIEVLEITGFNITAISAGSNPVYCIKYAENEVPIMAYSKKWDAPFNPSSEFVAVMTCSDADEGCPNVLGSEKRFAITYSDPKSSDNTEKQTECYAATNRLIATEFYYVFRRVKESLIHH